VKSIFPTLTHNRRSACPQGLLSGLPYSYCGYDHDDPRDCSLDHGDDQRYDHVRDDAHAYRRNTIRGHGSVPDDYVVAYLLDRNKKIFQTLDSGSFDTNI
jgi:hypothetical protein